MRYILIDYNVEIRDQEYALSAGLILVCFEFCILFKYQPLNWKHDELAPSLLSGIAVAMLLWVCIIMTSPGLNTHCDAT